MASCQTSQWGNSSPYVKLTVTESSTSTGAKAVLSWKLEYIAQYAAETSVAKSYVVKIAGSEVKSGTFSINGKTGTKEIASGTKEISRTTSEQTIKFELSFDFNLKWSGIWKYTLTASSSITVAAKTSYKISYNANGGSDAPAVQTKWYGTNLTLSSIKPTRTGYTFQGWATSSSGSVAYASGASYTANSAVTLYAVWKANTYSVKYNANGGSGAPGNQTKTYGVDLTLSSTKPTRTNYTFKGWGTSASATTVSYAAGAKYTKNAAITLYAVWELSYVKPRITSFSVARCDSSKKVTDDGTNALVSFNWATDKTISSIKIEWKLTTASTWSSKAVTASGTSGSVSEAIGSNSLSTESIYDIRVTVADANGNTVKNTKLRSKIFLIDCLKGGKSIAFGKPSELTDIADFAFKIRSRQNATFDNDKSIMGVDTDGTEYSALIPVTASGNTSLGHGLYKAGKGNTHIYGNKVQFYTNDGIYANGNPLYFNNNTCIYGTKPDGTIYEAINLQNANGNLVFGYDNYDNANGQTNVYGHDIYLGISNIATPGTYRPYRRKGDSVTFTLRTAGYVTNGSKDVVFLVPFSVPIVGSPTVSVTSGDGFILRQGAKYTHGSTATVYVKPSSYSAVVSQWCGVFVTASFSDITNTTNNDSIGIYWNGTITFS